jgi:hypothetical protein
MADPFEKIEIPRRKFVRQLAAGTFAAPTLLSFTPTAQGQSGTDTPGSSQPPTPTPSGSLGPFPSQPPTPTPSGSLGPFASPTPTPSHSGGAGCLRFGEFVARGDVKLSDKSKGDQFKLKGLFVLGAGNDGIDPVTETVVIGLGPAQYTIPPGLFRARGSGKSLRFTFDGTIGVTRLKIVIEPLEDGSYRVTAQARNTDLTGITNPATFSLVIGNDCGDTTILLDDDEATFGADVD